MILLGGLAYQVFSFTMPAFRALAQTTALSELAAFRPWRFRTSIGNDSHLVNGQLVSGNYFHLLGVKTAIGRTITPDDDRAAVAGTVAVLSYEYWQRAFGANPAVLGRGRPGRP